MRMKSASVRKPGDEDPGAGSQLQKEKKYKGLHVCDSGDNQVPFLKDTVELDTRLRKGASKMGSHGAHSRSIKAFSGINIRLLTRGTPLT